MLGEDIDHQISKDCHSRDGTLRHACQSLTGTTGSGNFQASSQLTARSPSLPYTEKAAAGRSEARSYSREQRKEIPKERAPTLSLPGPQQRNARVKLLLPLSPTMAHSLQETTKELSFYHEVHEMSFGITVMHSL